MVLARGRRLVQIEAKKPRVAKAGLKGVSGISPTEPLGAFDVLRRRLRRRVENGQWAGLAACVFVDGKLRLLEEAGHADLEGKTPMTKHSLVRLYSMTKCIVAAAVLQLAEGGHFGLNDKLSDHIPAFGSPRVVCEGLDGLPNFQRRVPAKGPILIRHLLTHTSGISCGLAPGLDGPKTRKPRERAWAGIYAPLVGRVDRGEIRDLAHWVDELAALPLFDQPGATYGYGYSYDVLGHLVELKSGMKLARYLQEHIFNPLGMRDSCFDLASGPGLASRRSRLSVLYRHAQAQQQQQ
ncbi:unnamed protein product [Polarella glacialis]|uniref:Beta-lactamase-related domain-containing protein n=1 Tax=Polarella glacialis TaxID=89957 RepID=A0A813EFJ8_POLGL|nr:unnamed protein product [Polarella glacialis]